MVCGAAARCDVVNVAVPAFSTAVPSVVRPSVKVTIPDGMDTLAAFTRAPGATVAVNVTFWPYTEGASDETLAVAVGALRMVKVSGDESTCGGVEPSVTCTLKL